MSDCSNGTELTLKYVAEDLVIPEKDRDIVTVTSRFRIHKEKLFRRIYLEQTSIRYCCGSVSTGNYRNSKRHGLCTLHLNTKDYIKAEYHNGLRHGMGFAQFNDYTPFKMISYEGEYEYDMKTGYGEMLLDNSSTFNGEWVKDLQLYGNFDGNGHKYMGYWIGKMMDKQGIYRTPEGRVYRGEIRNGKFVGEGEYIDQDQQQIIKGKFEENGDLKEKGHIITPELEYEGQVKYGKPHGFGKMNWIVKGEQYEGYWENGIMHGEGQLKRADMSVYKGEFEHGLFNGEGQIVFADTSFVKGSFKNGVLTGKGIYRYKTNDPKKREEYTGRFSKGQPHGVGTLKFVNGSIYSGEFREGKMAGQGKLAIASEKTEIMNNECYIGQFQDDEYDGRIL